MPARSRSDGRRANELRPVSIEPQCLKFPPGSALIKAGDTHVLCAATLREGVPDFLVGRGAGWLTAEYGMLPASTPTRKAREATLGRLDGRTQEIRRLIGRALRAAINLDRLGERTIHIDCDVLQADGSTRTVAVTGAWVALALAVRRLKQEGILTANPIKTQIAAVSVGMVNGRPLLDLTYAEDSAAAVDMNVVLTRKGEFIEIQGTAEGSPFGRGALDRMLALARAGCRGFMRAQRAALTLLLCIFCAGCVQVGDVVSACAYTTDCGFRSADCGTANPIRRPADAIRNPNLVAPEGRLGAGDRGRPS